MSHALPSATLQFMEFHLQVFHTYIYLFEPVWAPNHISNLASAVNFSSLIAEQNLLQDSTPNLVESCWIHSCTKCTPCFTFAFIIVCNRFVHREICVPIHHHHLVLIVAQKFRVGASHVKWSNHSFLPTDINAISRVPGYFVKVSVPTRNAYCKLKFPLLPLLDVKTQKLLNALVCGQ